MPNDSDKRKFKQNIAGVFSRAASTYGRIGPSYFDYFAERLVAFVEIPPGANVLDVATGTGAVLVPATQAAGTLGRVTGVDLSAEMTLRAKGNAARTGRADVDLCVMDAEGLCFSDDSFDVVLCAMGVMFFPNLRAVIEQITRILRKPGRLGVSSFGGQDEVSRRIVALAHKYGVKKKLIWNSMRSKSEHRDLLEKFGFQDICTTAEKADFVYRDADEWWAMNWSAGSRGILEGIAEDRREQFRADAIATLGEYLRDDGIHHPRNVLYTKAIWIGA